MILVIISILTYLFAELFAWVDFMYIVTFRISPKHWSRAVIRFVVLSIFCIVPNWNSWQISPYYLAISCSLFWIVFELRLNHRRNLNLFYIGKTASSDILFRSLGIVGEKLFVFKILLLFNSLVALYFSSIINNLILQLCQLLNS